MHALSPAAYSTTTERHSASEFMRVNFAPLQLLILFLFFRFIILIIAQWLWWHGLCWSVRFQREIPKISPPYSFITVCCAVPPCYHYTCCMIREQKSL